MSKNIIFSTSTELTVLPADTIVYKVPLTIFKSKYLMLLF